MVTIFFGVSGSFQIYRLQSIDLGHREPKWLCLWFDLERPVLAVTIFLALSTSFSFFHCFYTKWFHFYSIVSWPREKKIGKNWEKREKRKSCLERGSSYSCTKASEQIICAALFSVFCVHLKWGHHKFNRNNDERRGPNECHFCCYCCCRCMQLSKQIRAFCFITHLCERRTNNVLIAVTR